MSARAHKGSDPVTIHLSRDHAACLSGLLGERIAEVAIFQHTHVAAGRLPAGIMEPQLRTLVQCLDSVADAMAGRHKK